MTGAPAGTSQTFAAPDRPYPIRAVLFDLDGTLIDTAVEIATALERTFGELDLQPPSHQQVRDLIGRGVTSLVQRALPETGAARLDLDGVVARFETHYADTVATTAQLYDGVEPAFELLLSYGVPMGVVTNKPRCFAQRLLDRCRLLPRLSAVIAGDDGLPKKPEPDMIVAACDRLGAIPRNTLMLGDSDNDVLASRRAGCRIWCVPYGYNEGRPTETLACDRLVPTTLAAAELVIRAMPST